jgi:hypothetical protein
MRRLLFLFVFAAACSETETENEPAACPPENVREAEAVEAAASAFAAWEARERTGLAAACAAIADDLGRGPIPLSAPPTLAETEFACAQADVAVDERLDGGASLARSETDPGDCTTDAGAEVACRSTCGAAPSCANACRALVLFDAACTPPSVNVESDDPELLATVAANLPALRALSHHVSELVEPGFHTFSGAAGSALESLGSEAGCVDTSAVVYDSLTSTTATLGDFSDLFFALPHAALVDEAE